MVYAADRPLRTTVRDHLYAFARHSQLDWTYFNAQLRRVPEWLSQVDFDVVVFHTTFLALRWTPDYFEERVAAIEPLRGLGRARVAIPQDEFYRAVMVGDFVNRFDINLICSNAKSQDWPTIYPNVDLDRVQVKTVLTGYLEDATIAKIERYADRRSDRRPVDVNYRAWHAAPWLGRHGRHKVAIAELFRREAPRYGLKVDISTDEADVVIGEDWLRFLSDARYTIGVEGGASIADQDGSVKACTEAFVAANPMASFEQIAAACFASRDGEIDLRALSPRHLEACAARTCQILVRGDYNGVLEPDRHYIPLEPDYSNVTEVLESLHDDERRERIVQAAYDDVVRSGRYGSKALVDSVLSVLSADSPAAGTGLPASFSVRNGIAEAANPLRIALRNFPDARYRFLSAVSRKLRIGAFKARIRRLIGRT